MIDQINFFGGNFAKSLMFFSFIIMKIIMILLGMQLCGCLAHQEYKISQNVLSGDLKLAETYPDFLSLIKNYELLMIENFKRKQMLIVKSPKQENILHPRHDLKIRAKILKSFSKGDLQNNEKDLLLDNCLDLHKLWQKQKKQIQMKRFQLGLIR